MEEQRVFVQRRQGRKGEAAKGRNFNALRHAQDRQFAFRVQTDAAILGAGIVLAGGADTYPTPPATPRHHPKLTASFAPKGTKCNLRFASFFRSKTILWTFADSGLRCRITVPTSGESGRFICMA
jgi:hypothetical protein